MTYSDEKNAFSVYLRFFVSYSACYRVNLFTYIKKHKALITLFFIRPVIYNRNYENPWGLIHA